MERNFIAIWSDANVGTVCAIEEGDRVLWAFASSSSYLIDQVLECEQTTGAHFVSLKLWSAHTKEKFIESWVNHDRCFVATGAHGSPVWIKDGWEWDASKGPHRHNGISKPSIPISKDDEHRRMLEFFIGRKNTDGCTCGAWRDGGGHYDWCYVATGIR